jgi:SpoVK/Ycf46/Vps4 family AAA+-type ATPase
MTAASRPGPAVVERVADLRVGDDHRLYVVCGPCVDDLFVGHDYLTRGIQELLWELLKEQGFDRVVFSRLRRPVYFLDQASRELSRARTATPAPPARAGGGRAMRHFQGPLGSRVIADDATPAPGGAGPATVTVTPAGAGAPAAERPAAMTDQHGLMMIDHFMRQAETRTAVVLTQAEEWLRFAEARRAMAGVFAEWLEPGGDGNTCVLVFRQQGLAAVHEFVRELRQFPRLESYLDQQRRRVPARRGAAEIGPPQAAEVERLVHNVRLRHGLVIGDWPRLPLLTRELAESTNLQIRDWQALLRRWARDGTPLDQAALRDAGWLDSAVPDGRSVWDRLAEMPGMVPVKEHLERLRWRLEAERELQAASPGGHREPSSPHLVFTGNPGTGKTTVARLVGELYRELGLLRRGHVVETKASELIAGFIGQTGIGTERKIDEALDGVLFIDEAYQLSEQRDEFGQQAIDTLLARMENERERLVVVVAGYPERMSTFIASNPGLSGRFPYGNVIQFPDFDPAELLEILLARLRATGLTWEPETEAGLGAVVTRMRQDADEFFANARAMRNLADELTGEWAQRVRGRVSEPLTLADVPEHYRAGAGAPPPAAEVLAELDHLIGLRPVKDMLGDLIGRLRIRHRRGDERPDPPHLLFLGPPGTGKTTVARLLGEMFHRLGLLRRGHVHEVTRADLVGRYLGQTAQLTREAVRAALDGVLFIDEAYSLARGNDWDQYGTEAIDILTREMEQYRGRLVVVAAGYGDAMEVFLDRNKGLRSRFTERVEFPSYLPAELLEILRGGAARERFRLSPAAEARAAAWLAGTQRAQGADFGNARAVRTLLERIEARVGRRDPEPAGDGTIVVLGEDVPDARG